MQIPKSAVNSFLSKLPIFTMPRKLIIKQYILRKKLLTFGTEMIMQVTRASTKFDACVPKARCQLKQIP